MLRTQALFDATAGDWHQRLDVVVSMMREMSLQSDPEAIVRTYGEKMASLLHSDRRLSLSRRGLDFPRFRVTRYSGWDDPINPWTQKDRLPILEGGLLAELIYADEPRIVNDLRISPDDPAFPYLDGMRSLMALPNYDQGQGLNLVLALRADPDAFDPETLPERVWMSNLFGRATANLVLRQELERAYATVDRELNRVAEIQRSLLPKILPDIPHLSVAAHYQTSQWAGGDYYDFFELSDGKWGLLIADVSGHGTPAAVMMAITHAVAHGHPGHPDPPSKLLEHVNDRLSRLYTADGAAFVTAFYAIFDPATRTLSYANAGHNPPRLKRCSDGSIGGLDAVGGLPLGVFPGIQYEQATAPLTPGDQLVLYTDGITDATDPDGRYFGLDRLDRSLYTCREDADELIASVLRALDRFTKGHPVEDDRTMLVAKVS
ncbi:PP2C family protein-serine/threonine phosphatase [Tautonia plasticadhaerens]|uniref:Phosphoserine phosphatase RsbU n=1 Tax=Tautonia plasticadhaerens TaxID=2527974 RepID=A0A518HCQ7_9BACT|nr:PP2C family protein-serine/threonine phosphatase [Tautonia plasticadhaerens]QDV38637.1 Phosphoserine phosphatase RsbU [Tautonia plasticadhaerens]